MTNRPFLGGGHVVADSLFIVATLVCGSFMLGLLWYAVVKVLSRLIKFKTLKNKVLSCFKTLK